MPIVFFFYPETKDRSLESIEAMFSSSKPFYRDMEKAYRKAGNGDVLGARHLSVSHPSANAQKFTIGEHDEASFSQNSEKAPTAV